MIPLEKFTITCIIFICIIITEIIQYSILYKKFDDIKRDYKLALIGLGYYSTRFGKISWHDINNGIGLTQSQFSSFGTEKEREE